MYQNTATNKNTVPMPPQQLQEARHQQETTAKSKTPYSDATILDRVTQAELLKTFDFSESDIERIIFKDGLISEMFLTEIMDYALKEKVRLSGHPDLPSYYPRSNVAHLLACTGNSPRVAGDTINLALSRYPDPVEPVEKMDSMTQEHYRDLTLTAKQMLYCVDFVLKLSECTDGINVPEDLKESWRDQTSKECEKNEQEINDLMPLHIRLIKSVSEHDDYWSLVDGIYPVKALKWLRNSNLMFQHNELIDKRIDKLNVIAML